MPTISTCPRCSQMVAVPPDLDAATLVRCPLCGAEYPLGAAMDLIPPELTPVETGHQEMPPETVPPKMALPRTATEETNIVPPPIIPSFLMQHATAEEGEEGSHSSFAADASEETAETSDSPLDEEVYNLIAKHTQKTGEKSPNSAESQSAANRPQRKTKSELRIFLEIIFGGILGLAITYIALAWIMGSKFPLPSPPKALKPVLRFVLPDRIWPEKQ